MIRNRIKKCEFCNQELKSATGCLTCQEESIIKTKFKKVMSEFKKSKLHSGHGGLVTSQQQALAIALNEGRKEIKKNKK